ncbi:hypothetical protein TNCV_5112941 [Trichonephila clavipes]|nr:hypothetical protein TNCV_5112941 [Trichonephila clavipes]
MVYNIDSNLFKTEEESWIGDNPGIDVLEQDQNVMSPGHAVVDGICFATDCHSVRLTRMLDCPLGPRSSPRISPETHCSN